MTIKKFKKALSIVEISIVIAVLSLLAFAVYSGRGAIDDARAVKIVDAFRDIVNGVNYFDSVNTGLPGDKASSTIIDYSSQNSSSNIDVATGFAATRGNSDGYIGFGNATACSTNANTYVNESSYAMYQLSYGSYVSSINKPASNRALYGMDVSTATVSAANASILSSTLGNITSIENAHLSFISTTTPDSYGFFGGVTSSASNILVLGAFSTDPSSAPIDVSGLSSGVTFQGNSCKPSMLNIFSTIPTSIALKVDKRIDGTSSSLPGKNGAVRYAVCTYSSTTLSCVAPSGNVNVAISYRF